ncbi:MAG: hypothetical protein ACM31C_22155 [Acidobacteriota bacterium]
MRVAVAVLAFTTSTAIAQPGATDEFEACKARRRELTAEAMTIADASERGERLAHMPTCERDADGTTRVVEAPPPPPPETEPFAPHLAVALHAGAGASSRITGSDPSVNGIGPFVELEGSWGLRRHVELAVVGGYASFRDASYAVPIGFDAYGNVITGMYDVRERLYDVGARVRLRYDNVSFGCGGGVELEQAFAYAAYHDESDVLAQAVAEGAYRVAQSGELSVDVLASVTAALNPGRWTSNALDRDVLSARLAVGLRWR